VRLLPTPPRLQSRRFRLRGHRLAQHDRGSRVADATAGRPAGLPFVRLLGSRQRCGTGGGARSGRGDDDVWVTERNKAAADARRRRAAAPLPMREALLHNYRETGDRTDRLRWADVTGWWRDPELLGRLGPALAELFAEAQPTVILGTPSRGTLLGALVATHLGVGLVEIRKDDGPAADSEGWFKRITPPDYRDRHLTLGFPKQLLQAGEQVLFVDDWIDTGGQALGARGLVEDAGAHWLGAAVVVDALADSRLRRDLVVRSLLHNRELTPGGR